MNRSIAVLAGATLIFGSASAYFWQQERASEERAAVLEARVKELESALAAPQSLPQAPSAPVSPFTSMPAPQGAARAAVGASLAPTAPKVAEGAPAMAGVITESPFRTMRMDKLLEDPEYRAALRTQHRMSMGMRFPDLAHALNLQPDQVDKLMELLTDQEMANMGRPPFAMDGTPPDPAAIQQWSKQMAQRQKDNEAQIANLLGDAGLQEWKEYQKTLGARMQVKQLRDLMDTSADPLRRDQVEQLVSVMAAEQRRGMESAARNSMPGTRAALMAGGPMRSFTPGNQLSLMEQSLEQTIQNNQRMHDAVAPYLSPRQLDQFDRYQNQQVEMQRASLRMMRARKEAEERGEIPANSNSMAVSSMLVPATP